jgi:hypothetical protein
MWPKLVDHYNELNSIQGIEASETYYHSSNMTTFPKRKHKGESEIPYGIPVSIIGEAALNQIMLLLAKP